MLFLLQLNLPLKDTIQTTKNVLLREVSAYVFVYRLYMCLEPRLSVFLWDVSTY